MDKVIVCPVCGEGLFKEDRTFGCANGHRFDPAREGYLNLLRSSKKGETVGDDPAACRARRDLLNKGYYSPLRDFLCNKLSGRSGRLLDICCGEGYYTSAFAGVEGLEVYGFDISKEMVRLAAKRGKGRYFVANLAHVPVASGSFDLATHLFAPFNAAEFARVLKSGGELFTVFPGARHLFGLKAVLYDRPYENDERLPSAEGFELVGTERVGAETVIEGNGDISALFRMTPYYFRTPPENKKRLEGVERLPTELEFVIATYKKI